MREKGADLFIDAVTSQKINLSPFLVPFFEVAVNTIHFSVYVARLLPFHLPKTWEAISE